GGDHSSQALEMIRELINRIKEQVGASDAALGNVRPDNAQAIIAASQQAGVPMELTKLNHKDFVEQEVRIIADMMRNHYGKREVSAESFKAADGTIIADADGNPVKSIMFDFAALESPDMRLNIDVGEASYWSEMRDVQTLDNLFHNAIIGARLYVESMPGKYIPNREKVLEEIKKQEAMQQAAATQTLQQGNPLQTPGSVLQ
ncbi:MAG TPA: hypothetical protein VN437_00805, partial [Rectinemataceae bacterium]|nr:hypothetical protein [Rectinemataceae bacterium]